LATQNEAKTKKQVNTMRPISPAAPMPVARPAKNKGSQGSPAKAACRRVKISRIMR